MTDAWVGSEHDASQNAILNAPAPDQDSLDAARWQQVLARDSQATFVYAVRTTGIFCRATCPSRRPLPAHVLFFRNPRMAVEAGFRACLRCRPDAQPDDSALVERLTAYLARQSARTVSLAELARVAGCAPATVQRIFLRVLGLSPRAWVNSRRAEAYRALLTDSGVGRPNGGPSRITDAVYEAGFSSTSRAHHAAPLGMEARRYRAQGAGERIGYAIADAPLGAPAPAPDLTQASPGVVPAASVRRGETLGRVLVAATRRGICAVLLGDEDQALVAELAQRFPQAELAAEVAAGLGAKLDDDQAIAPQLAAVLDHLTEHPSARTLPLDLRGTAFQARVWAALAAIPRGETRSYAQLASSIGSPSAVRAVAAACGQNPAAIVVPCHRVLGSNGKLTGYRWGVERKRALLAHEHNTSE